MSTRPSGSPDDVDEIPSLPAWLVDPPGTPSSATVTDHDQNAPNAPNARNTPSATARSISGSRKTQSWRARLQGAGLLSVLVGLIAPVVMLATPVEIHVDGQVLAVQTYRGTVGEVIDRFDIDIGSRDIVVPAHDEVVAHGAVIDVQRAITVDVHVDGSLVHRVVAPVASIGAVLEQAGLGRVYERRDELSPAILGTVEDGGQVEVWTPQSIRLTVDGEDREVASFARDVEELLADEGVELGPHDHVSHSLDTPLSAAPVVVVARIQVDEEIEEIVIPYPVVREPSDDVWRGTTQVVQEGRDGIRFDRYRVVEVDGEVTERELISQQVAVAPEPRIVLVGNYIDWDALARCESGGNWSINAHGHLDAYSDARYYGGLQFNHRSWRAAGGLQYAYWPHEATREQQIATAERLFDLRRNWGMDPWGGWPACSRRLGIR